MENKVQFNGVYVKNVISVVELINRLSNIANCINTYIPSVEAYIEEIWMDYGAKISWLTILVKNRERGDSYQLLAPVEMVAIIEGDYDTNLRFVIEKIKEIKERGW